MGAKMKYGQRLDLAMAEAKVTRKALSIALQCTPQAIGMVINGVGGADRALTLDSTFKAAKYLEVRPEWLGVGQGEMREAPPVPATGHEIDSLSSQAMDLAIFFDKLRGHDARAMAYVEAMTAILKTLALTVRDEPNSSTATHPLDFAATPKKLVAEHQPSLN